MIMLCTFEKNGVQPKYIPFLFDNPTSLNLEKKIDK